MQLFFVDVQGACTSDIATTGCCSNAVCCAPSFAYWDDASVPVSFGGDEDFAGLVLCQYIRPVSRDAFFTCNTEWGEGGGQTRTPRAHSLTPSNTAERERLLSPESEAHLVRRL